MIRLLPGLVLVALAMPAGAEQNRLIDVRVATDGAGAVVEIVGTRPPSFTTASRDGSLVIDFDGAVWPAQAPVAPGVGPLLQLRLASRGKAARLTLELAQGAEAALVAAGNSLLVAVQPGIGVAPAVAASEQAEPVPVAEARIVEAGLQAREEAERIARAEVQAREEAERVARAEVQAREEAERIARAKVQAREEAERVARAEVQAREEAERIAQAEQQAREEAERIALAEQQAREESQRIALAEQQAREAAERIARTESTRSISARPVATAPAPLRPAAATQELTYLGFKPTAAGARIVLRTAGRPVWRMEQAPGRLVLVLDRARIPLANNRRSIDASFFGTPVGLIKPVEDARRDEVRVEIGLRSADPHFEITVAGQELLVDFAR